MSQVDEMKERHAREIAELEAELRIAEALPLAPRWVTSSGSKRPWACYNIQAADAPAFVEAFAPRAVRFSSWRGRYVGFGTEPAKDDTDARPSSRNYGAAIRVQQGEGHGPTAELILFIEEPRVRVDARICGLGYIDTAPMFGARFTLRHDHRGRVKALDRTPNSVLAGPAAEVLGPYWRERETLRQADYVYLFESAAHAAEIVAARVVKARSA